SIGIVKVYSELHISNWNGEFFFFQAEDGIRDRNVTGVQTCALPISLDLLGKARKITVTKDDTTVVEGEGNADDIKGRINQIKGEIEKTDSDYDREKLQERLAKLAGGVAVIKVGAATEVELKEKKHRIED